MANTPNGVPYPTDGDIPDAPFWIQQLAEYIDLTVADTGWLPIELAEGWEVKSGIAQARRIGRIVYLGGLVGLVAGTIPAGSNMVFAQLPEGVGMEPSQSEWFACGTNTSQDTTTVIVLASGGLQLRSPDEALSYVGLGSIMYPSSLFT